MRKIQRYGGALLILLTALSLLLRGVRLFADLNAKYGCTSQTSSEQILKSMALPPVARPMTIEQSEGGTSNTVVPRPTETSKKLRVSGKRTCPSQYRNKNNGNEHSPVIFKEHNLMVCRSPKVGSNELRSVATAYETDTPFVPPSANVPYHGSILAGIRNSKTFNHYLYDDNVTRIMFVRHPVHRLLSAFLQTARGGLFWRLHGFDKNLRASPETFRRWVTNKELFFKYFHSTCNENSTEMDIHFKIQHFAPPQHCRCGIFDCGVGWKVFKIEDHSIQSVLSEYLPQKYLPPANTTEILHKMKYTKKDYLTPDILDFLNAVTKEEQEFFVYKPLTMDDL